ncbi:DUF2493 domain-containing protein [Alcanivorax sp. S6407]|uniref:DUF2493 domain-containing protein n=1 Tax=Alcanivorax sp. S6407 TaxID=2926424 RepID=UPI001FF6A90D|nr:DUF2493 domain-containing protein [Alcanivorax sp. S6407]MCK0154016.1 DUF2493 domain-containing protein [Alcanivorax sp. S6407]
MRVLVCGGRDYRNDECITDSLERLRRAGLISLLIHGDASGADRLASQWARESGMDQVSYPANWKAHGRAAGPMRNRRMLHHGRPQALVAFPGGRGTADMVELARQAGLPVWQPEREQELPPFTATTAATR